MKNDLIRRQAAIRALCKAVHKDDDTIPCDNQAVSCLLSKTRVCDFAREIYRVPSAQPDLDEWCTDCKEYDKERHCCPRWNRVIRKTAEEVRQNAAAEPKWIPCESELPNKYGNYLITTDEGEVDIGSYNPDIPGAWSACDARGFHWVWGVVAWMPLLKPYERSEE